jgi:macrolide transport system ATP-binding/permease protein
MSSYVAVSYGDKNASTMGRGCEFVYGSMHNATPIVGRMFTDEENAQRARVCVLGKTVIANLYPEGFDPVGSEIEINKCRFRVIGILPVKGSNGTQDQDDVVLIPLQTFQYRILGWDVVGAIEFEAKDAESVDAAIQEISAFCRDMRHIAPGQPDDFVVRNLADMKAAQQDISATIQNTLFVIACVSLLVGGIGIMNIMLVSVNERTKEIGLRKALGARNAEVLFQFLVEALLICLIGGILGIGVGVSAALGVAMSKGWLILISWNTVAVAVVVSAMSGIIFGLRPAWQASQLSPIEALRQD